jgi:hypothetical protein
MHNNGSWRARGVALAMAWGLGLLIALPALVQRRERLLRQAN